MHIHDRQKNGNAMAGAAHERQVVQMIDDIHFPMAGRHNETMHGGSLRRGIAEKVECEENKKNPEGSRSAKELRRQNGGKQHGAANQDRTKPCPKNEFKRRAPGLPRMFHKINLIAKNFKIQTNFKAR
jgi:hypothetical protein